MKCTRTRQMLFAAGITRLLSSAAMGLMVTVGLLYLMVLLIAATEEIYTDQKQFEFCWMCRSEPRPRPAPVVMPVPERPPKTIPLPEFTLTRYDAGELSVKVRHAPQPPGGDFGTSTVPGFANGSLTLIMKVKPAYPVSALLQGIEGYVIVEYDVTAAGTVRDAWVIESSDQLFDDVALAAVSQYLYKPRMLNGMPQETKGLKNMFKFEIQKKKE